MDIDELLERIPEKEEYIFYIHYIKQASEEILSGQLVIGFCLSWFNNGDKYVPLGYRTLAEFSMDFFKLKRSSTYNYLKVYEECAEGRIEEDVIKVSLLEEYEEYSSIYQLVELLKTPIGLRNSIKANMSVREIREKRKEVANKNERGRVDIYEPFDDSSETDSDSKVIKSFRNIKDLFSEETMEEVISFFDNKESYLVDLIFRQE